MIIKNASVLNGASSFEDKDLIVENDTISSTTSDHAVLDAKGCYALPGFIDLHFHGAMNCDFMDGNAEALKTIARYEAGHGITSISPASMTMDKKSIFKALDNALNFKPADGEASLEGVYLEGPFISERKLGAQNGSFVMQPDKAFVREILEHSHGLVKVITIAPEKAGAYEVIKEFREKVRFSLAHTDATYEDATGAFECGATELTHSFNAMNPIHHRKPGPLIAAYENQDKIFAELISDGIHIHPAIIRFVFDLFSNVVMISDSMEATGLEDGSYALGGQKVIVKGPKATLEDGTLAGSVSNLYECFKVAVKEAKVDLIKAANACSRNPAMSIGIYDKVGSIENNKRADILIVDKNSLELKHVILRGKILF